MPWDRAFEPGPDDLERWLPVLGWPGYEVSDWGRVQSYRRRGNGGGVDLTARIIGNHVTASGHRNGLLVRYRDGRRETRSFGVHVLVLEAFVGPCPRGLECCHNDGNPANNRLANLRWDTRSANVIDQLRHWVHNNVILDEYHVRAIWKRLVSGEPASRIAKDFGVSRATICLIRSGPNWSHVTKSLPGWPLVLPDRNDKQPVYIPDEFAKAIEEIWRPIRSWSGYRVSNRGNVQSRLGRGTGKSYLTKEWHDIKPNRVSGGYHAIIVRGYNTPRKSLLVHNCVLEAFAGERPSGMIGCHIDSDRTNNHASNLRWDTYAANARDRVEHAKKCAT
jgi:hypothetical protein